MPKEKDPETVHLGARLTRAAIANQLATAAALARRMQLEESRVRNWLNGTSQPTIAEAKRLKAALKIDLDYIYDGDTAGVPNVTMIALEAVAQGIQPVDAPGRAPPVVFPQKAASPKRTERSRQRAVKANGKKA